MLFGTSGGGKSTLLNIIGTIDKPTKGNVFVCGTSESNWIIHTNGFEALRSETIRLVPLTMRLLPGICDSTTDNELAAIRLNKLGFVFQTFNLIAQLTALENVELPLALQGSLSASDRRKRATRALPPPFLFLPLNVLPSHVINISTFPDLLGPIRFDTLLQSCSKLSVWGKEPATFLPSCPGGSSRGSPLRGHWSIGPTCYS